MDDSREEARLPCCGFRFKSACCPGDSNEKQNSRVLANPAELLSFGVGPESVDLVVHAAHSTHAAARRHGGELLPSREAR
jgi:hypothetical protein